MRSEVRDIRSRPIRNLINKPQPALASLLQEWAYATRGSVAIASVNGESALVFTASEAQASGPSCRVHFRMSPAQANTPLRPNTTYTLFVEMTSITKPKKIGTAFELNSDAGRYHVLSDQATTSKQRLVRTWTSPADLGTTRYIWFYVEGPMEIGDQFAIHRVMLVEGNYTGEYSDGNTPGWKWQGAQYASTSVGWPYTLESIVGKPVAELKGTAVESIPVNVDVRQSSLYMYTPSTIPVNARASVNRADGLEIFGSGRTSAGASYFSLMRNSSGNSVVQSWSHLGTSILATLGRDDGMLTYSSVEGFVFRGLPPITDPGVEFISNNSAVRALLFNRGHSQQTAESVIAWLKNKYMVP